MLLAGFAVFVSIAWIAARTWRMGTLATVSVVLIAAPLVVYLVGFGAAKIMYDDYAELLSLPSNCPIWSAASADFVERLNGVGLSG